MKVVRNFTLVKRHAEDCSELGWVLQVVWVIIVDTIKFVVILKTRARIEFVQKVLNSVSHILDMSLPLKVNKILTACKPTFLDYWLIKNTNIPSSIHKSEYGKNSLYVAVNKCPCDR